MSRHDNIDPYQEVHGGSLRKRQRQMANPTRQDLDTSQDSDPSGRDGRGEN